MDTEFLPNGEKAAYLNTRMNTELGKSLFYVCAQANAAIEFEEKAILRLCKHLSSGRDVSPHVFGLYYSLVDAIEREDEQSTKTLFSHLAEPKLLRAVDFFSQFGSKKDRIRSEIYEEKWQETLGEEIEFCPPSENTYERFIARIKEGMELLRIAVPALHAEISAIIHQIVIIGTATDAEYHVDGGSHYKLWGALFLNGEFHEDRVSVAEVLAHESAHSVLFGYSIDDLLTENDPSKRYPSPLRRDLRPMDGIYHATYVSARMHWAMTQLSKSDYLTQTEQERAASLALADAENFVAGYDIVRAHGELTGLGKALMDGAYQYMRSAAPHFLMHDA